MKIGFDAKRLFLNHSGLGNYSRNLLDALATAAPNNEYLLFTPSYNETFGQFRQSPYRAILPEGTMNNLFKTAWRSRSVIKQIQHENPDVYHGLSNELPYTLGEFNRKKIVTIHDLIFMRFPSYYGAFDRQNYRKKVKSACEIADTVISISQQTKNDLVEFFGVNENKIAVHGQSCSTVFWEHKTQADHSIHEKAKIPSQYILYVGTVEPRKNLFNLVQALKQTDVPLVVVGKIKSAYGKKIKEFIAQNNMQSQVIFVAIDSTKQLAALYERAACVVYPSSFEGFGLPVLEAMVCGCPVITGNNSSLTEVGGDAAFYINVDRIEEYTNAINNVIKSNDVRKDLVLKGLEQSKKFSREAWAQKTLKTYA